MTPKSIRTLIFRIIDPIFYYLRTELTKSTTGSEERDASTTLTLVDRDGAKIRSVVCEDQRLNNGAFNRCRLIRARRLFGTCTADYVSPSTGVVKYLDCDYANGFNLSLYLRSTQLQNDIKDLLFLKSQQYIWDSAGSLYYESP